MGKQDFVDARDRASREKSLLVDWAGGLTPSERLVLTHLCAGASNKEIAHALDCSVKTIEFHMSNLFRKSGVTSRTQLVSHALGRGLIELGRAGE